MALETLKNVKKLGEFDVLEYGALELLENGEGWSSPKNVIVDHRQNVISFKIQDGPIKENGVNGCQVDTMLATVKTIVEGLNKNYPCKENEKAIEKLTEALMWMEERKRDRVARGVEGFNKK